MWCVSVNVSVSGIVIVLCEVCVLFIGLLLLCLVFLFIVPFYDLLVSFVGSVIVTGLGIEIVIRYVLFVFVFVICYLLFVSLLVCYFCYFDICYLLFAMCYLLIAICVFVFVVWLLLCVFCVCVCCWSCYSWLLGLFCVGISMV